MKYLILETGSFHPEIQSESVQMYQETGACHHILTESCYGSFLLWFNLMKENIASEILLNKE